jgi:YD repeat-containing protein
LLPLGFAAVLVAAASSASADGVVPTIPPADAPQFYTEHTQLSDLGIRDRRWSSKAAACAEIAPMRSRTDSTWAVTMVETWSGGYVALGNGVPDPQGTACYATKSISITCTEAGIVAGCTSWSRTDSGVYTGYNVLQVVAVCPGNAEMQADRASCACNQGFAPNGRNCVPVFELDNTRKPLQCTPRYGNPIEPLGGRKIETNTIPTGLPGLSLVLTYNSSNIQLAASGGRERIGHDHYAVDSTEFGRLWRSNLTKRLRVSPIGVAAARGDGSVVGFAAVLGTGDLVAPPDIADRLWKAGDQYVYRDAGANTLEVYDAGGALRRIVRHDGASFEFAAPTVAGLLTTHAINDAFGRSARLELYSGRASQFVDAAQAKTTFQYHPSSGMLWAVVRPDMKVGYHYENTAFPWALTSRTEWGNRVATFGYDASGRAISSERIGPVGRVQVGFSQAPVAQVTDTYPTASEVLRTRSFTGPVSASVTLPNGSAAELTSTLVQGIPRLTSLSQPAGSGCAAASAQQTYDASGNVTSRVDFNGNKTCYAFSATRNLELRRVEGLPSTDACSTVLETGSWLPEGARATTTEWHPEWRLPTRIAAPHRITTEVYNGQPDPTAGNATADCAPADAVLPDGKPIAVLCKRVVQATTDLDGTLGLSGAIDATVPSRIWRWTYNRWGQVLTETDPRGGVTSYAYHADTTADVTRGDLQSMSNALGHTTSFPRYNRHGKPLRSIDANGVVTDYVYDVRQRLTSITVGGQTTAYNYRSDGLLTRVTLPDGTFLSYEYDGAQRNTAVVDNRGNRIEYTLDNVGNRVAESTKDSSGVLRRSLERAFDALDRVQRLTGRELMP